jgi:hypothetical protein
MRRAVVQMDIRVSGTSILGEEQSLDPLADAGHAARWGPRNFKNLEAALHMRHVRGAFKALRAGKLLEPPNRGAHAERRELHHKRLLGPIALPIADNLDNREIVHIL